jgi:hypothetical protein
MDENVLQYEKYDDPSSSISARTSTHENDEKL